MSAPATQTNNNGNGAPSQPQQANGAKPQRPNNRSSTPQEGDNRGGSIEGDAGHKKGRENPAHKKGWQAKAAGTEPGANGQDDQRRRGKEEGGDANPSNANGRKFDQRGNEGYKRNNRRENYSPAHQAQAPAQPEQQPTQPPPQPQVAQPHVDRQRVEESKRISSVIATPQPTIAELTADQRKAVAKVKEVVGAQLSDSDIYSALDQYNWDKDRVIEYLSDNPGATSWSEVVVRKRKEPQVQPEKQEKQDRPERSERPRRENRSERPDRERRPRDNYQQKANGQERYVERQQQPPQQAQQAQQPPHPQPAQQPPHQPQQQAQQAHQQAQQAAQQAHQAQQQAQYQAQQAQAHQVQQQLHQQHMQQLQQQQQYQQQVHQQQYGHPHPHPHPHQLQQQHPPEFSPADGEQLIMGYSKAIELQLAEIAEKSRVLIQMQTELANIHSANKDQLTQLQTEKSGLQDDKARLETQLREITDRLLVIDVAIDKAQQEKFHKIQEWHRKSNALALQPGHFITNH